MAGLIWCSGLTFYGARCGFGGSFCLWRSFRSWRLQRCGLHGGCLSALFEPLHTTTHYLRAGHNCGNMVRCNDLSPTTTTFYTRTETLNHYTLLHKMLVQATATAAGLSNPCCNDQIIQTQQ